MATKDESSSFELYECPVCCEDMVNRKPRLLRCHHSFCESCILKMIKAKQIVCPSCRHVTLVQSNVEDLAINFHLIKMREREHFLLSKDRLLCQLCLKKRATNKCQDCAKLLCNECTEKHNRMKQLQGHTVRSLCPRHHEGITHVCLHCIEGTCVVCMLSEHAEHEEEVKDYEEGMAMLKESAAEAKTEINKQISLMKTEVKEIQENIDKTGRFKLEIKTRISQYKSIISAYQEKMSDAEWLVGHIENTYDKMGVESLEVYRHAINLVMERGQQLEEVEKVKDLKFLSKYKSGVQNIEEIMKVPPPYKVPDMHVTPPAITKAVTDIVGYSKFCTPKLVYDIRSSEEFSLQSPLAVVFRERTSILVADYGENKVLQLTEKGQRINSYTLTDAESNVKSVSYFDAFIYIAQNGRITRIRARDKPSVTVYKPAVRFIRHIQAVNNKNIIITEAADPGRIFEYDPESNDLKTVAENLRQPSYITTADIDEGKRYIITIEDNHSIHVYNTQWKLESIIGNGKSEDEKLCYPHATAVTPKGTLLVANTHKSRISEFSMKGEFLGHVVTSEHGLKAPFGVAFRIPHIWITQSSAAPDDVAIKCYQVVN